MKILLTAINAKYIHSNLAVYSLQAYARKYQEHIGLAEFTINQNKEEILKGIFRRKPEVLCISCYIWNISLVKELVREIHKILPDTAIWLGGPEVSYDAEKVLKDHPEITGIMKGEGEATFLELAACYVESKTSEERVDRLEQIAGITYRRRFADEENNKAQDECAAIRDNGWHNVMDLSEIPFVYENLENFENRIIYYESSRGCPFSCSYCLSSVEKTLRFRNMDLVKKELKFFLDNKVSQVKFVDRTFNCKKSHAMEIWKYIHENDNGITNFHFEVAADLIDDEQLEIISKMRDGLIQLEIGVQSTNENTINEIHRTMKLDRLKGVVSKINSFGNTHQHLDLIAGLPFEDLESFKKSFNDVYYMRPKELQLGFLKVLSGSYMYDNKETYEIKFKEYPPYEVLSTKWISYDDILLLKGVEEMVEVYYNSGQFVLGLNFIENFFETPFNMFYELSKYYEEHFEKSAKHARITRYTQLISFMETRINEKELSKLKLLLTFDIYLRENAKSRPEFAKDNSLYKDEIKYIAKELGLRKNEHIEVLGKEDFDTIPLELISDVSYINCDCPSDILSLEDKTFLIFDYQYKNVITNQCRIKIYNR